ncbi:MAG: hypothetical protein H6541_13635 [Lentimicrobiaceae bacterium]|nr:hypothetical protein [Lentimicrobiaceae bacterium]MCO5266308.1 hypothetical protein [Lentimicrobium sp.]MCP5375427.1 hypothetical protein [Rickettsiaceae bacterium]
MKIKVLFLILLMSLSVKLKAQYGYYYNKDLSVGIDIISSIYFMQIFNTEMFARNDKMMIDSLLSRDNKLYNHPTLSDVLHVPMKGTLISGGISIEKDIISFKDITSNMEISSFIMIDSLTIKLSFSTFKTFSDRKDSLYFHKIVSYFKPNPNDFIPSVSWKYSYLDEIIQDTCHNKNWYFFDGNHNLIKIIPDTVLIHPFSNKKDKNN